jgi:hypothetical protein
LPENSRVFFIVRSFIKISGMLASITLMGFWVMSAHSEKKDAPCDKITITGNITPEIFLAAKDCLVNSTAKKKTFVVEESGGGNWESALALGILIHRHGWDVEVVGLCASSCANFIFPAGKVKYLHRESMLLFHGGPHQENLMSLATAMDQALATKSAPAGANEFGHINKEGNFAVDTDRSAMRQEVLNFLSVGDAPTVVELATRLRTRSDQFYEESGVNPLLGSYGQTGTYEPIYKSYKYLGFTYRLDSLRRLGLGNIEVIGGEWHPERNRAYPDVYEVTYP